MIEFKEVRKRFQGDERLAQLYLHEARVLLGEIKTRAGGEGPWRMRQTQRTLQLPNGVTITAISDTTGVSPRDEVIIDVRPLGPTVEKPPIEPEKELYIPYLWVGVREIAGGSGQRGDAQFDKDGSDFVLNFCVFEPEATLPESVVTVMGAHNYIEDIVEFPNAASFSTTSFWWSSNGYWGGDDLVWTDRGLFLATYGVASPLSPGYPKTLWQLCAILDPARRTLGITELGQFIFGGVTYQPGIGTFDEIPLSSRVMSGKYIVKLMGIIESCDRVWPTTYELKAIVGKAPGRITTHSTTFTISQGSAFFADWYPGGFDYFHDALYGFGNNRHDPKCWWQGALRIDVRNGTIAEEDDYYPQPKDYPSAWFAPRELLFDDCMALNCRPSPPQYKQEVTFQADNPFWAYDQDPDSPPDPTQSSRPPRYLLFKGAWVLSLQPGQSDPCRVQISGVAGQCNPHPIGEGEVWDASGQPGETYAAGEYVQVVSFTSGRVGISNKLNRSAIEQDPPVYLGDICPCLASGANNYQNYLKQYYPVAMVDNWVANNRCGTDPRGY